MRGFVSFILRCANLWPPIGDRRNLVWILKLPLALYAAYRPALHGPPALAEVPNCLLISYAIEPRGCDRVGMLFRLGGSPSAHNNRCQKHRSYYPREQFGLWLQSHLEFSRCLAWRRYHVRRLIQPISQGRLPTILGRPRFNLVDGSGVEPLSLHAACSRACCTLSTETPPLRATRLASPNAFSWSSLLISARR